MTTEQPRAWLLIVFEAEERQYGGNVGYADSPAELYRYDSMVANHKQVVAGDIVVLRDREGLIGVARVARILERPGHKTLRRCPTCGTTGIKERSSKVPRHRCNQGHEFDVPVLDPVECREYEAQFGDSFVAARGGLSVERLRQACPNYTDQLSIQRLDLEELLPDLRARLPQVERLLGPAGLAPIAMDHLAEVSLPPFIPTDEDARDARWRQIRERRGQPAFRRDLVNRYGAACMVSGCGLMQRRRPTSARTAEPRTTIRRMDFSCAQTCTRSSIWTCSG